MAYILTIDLGTTYFKFALFDRFGKLCDIRRIKPPLAETKLGRMEMPADSFTGAVAEGIGQLRSGNTMSEIEAVSFATQTNSFLLLDGDNRPLTPIILWPDERASELEAESKQRCRIPNFSDTTGIPEINRQFMMSKLLWIQRFCPVIWRKTRKMCLISDYLTLLMSGQHVTEAGASGLTGLVDIHHCKWWPEMLDRFDIDQRHLAAVVRAGTNLGTITPAAARKFGLPESCCFIVGCLDQYAGAIGVGNVEPGMISETTGTVLASVKCSDRFSSDLGPAVFQGPAFRDGLFWRMTLGNVSANYLQWYRDQLPDRPKFEQLTALAKQAEPSADGLRLRTDISLTTPEQVFDGLTPRHTRAAMVRCILETVATALKDQVAALCEGRPPQKIRCAGGAACSEVWLQIKADSLGVATMATQCEEPTSLGAAILSETSLANSNLMDVARKLVKTKPHIFPSDSPPP